MATAAFPPLDGAHQRVAKRARRTAGERACDDRIGLRRLAEPPSTGSESGALEREQEARAKLRCLCAERERGKTPRPS